MITPPEHETIYEGHRRVNNEATVEIHRLGGRGELPMRHDLRNHSPDGFEWGYGGSGPAQLALALLADAGGDDAVALRHYQDYKTRIVAGLPKLGWTLTQSSIRNYLEQREATNS